MAEGLKIQVAAEVSEAVKALERDIPKAVDAAVVSTEKLGKGFQYAGLQSQQMAQQTRASFQSIPPEVKKTSKAINIFEGSIEDLQARIGSRKSLLNTETDIKKIGALNKEISYLELQVSHLANTGRTKFDQFGQAITKSSTAANGAAGGINKVSFSIEGLGKGAQKAVAGLLRIAYILPGLGTAGLISGIVSVGGALLGMGGAADKTAVDFSGLAKAVEAQNEKQKELAAASDGAAKSVLSQAKELKDLRGILESTTSATGALTTATIKQGVARLIFSQKESELQKALSAEIEKQFLLRTRMGGVDAPEIISDPQLDKLKQANKTFTDLGRTDTGLGSAIKRIEELNKIIGTSRGSLNFLGSISEDLGGLFKGFVDDDKTKKKVKDLTSEIIAQAKKISDAFKNSIDLKLNISPLDTKKEELQKAIGFLKDFNAGNFKFTVGATAIVKIKDVEFPPPDVVLKDTRSDVERISDLFGKQYSDYFASAPIDVSLVLAVQDASAPLTAAQKLGQDTAKAFNEGMVNALSSSAAGIGNSIGTILSGGGIGDAFKQFASAIGSALQTMGEQIIGIGIAALLAKNALKTLFANPATAIIAGTALVAAGAALKNILSGGVKGFAQGGLVFGPTMGLVGEGSGTNRSNPEVIAPLDKLKSMLFGAGNNNSAPIVMTTQIRGRNLALVQARTSRYLSRTTGKR